MNLHNLRKLPDDDHKSPYNGSRAAIRDLPVSLHAFGGASVADRIFEQHRARLTALAYRMLGSHADAEDAVQDAWLRWRNQDHETINDATGWLVRVCSNICLDVLKSARRQRENYVGNWLPEPWLPSEGPKAEEQLIERDGLGQAYMLMLERLAPVERVALVLHEVFDWMHDDIAPLIERTPNNTRQILFRARRKMQRESDRDATPEPDATACDRDRLDAFVTAIGRSDVTRLLDLLAPDVILHSDGGGKAMATVNPLFGADHVSRFFVGIWGKRSPNERVFAITIEGECWILMAEGGGVASAICATERDGQIVDLFVHRNPDKLALFSTVLADAVEIGR
ncbi:RNA polymerase sigma factor SigJ [Thalassospira sp. HF15]|uniref:RNA polymerase sigma factor SigJ n=1 Tax=Thalassospira sp. HF15 TaxID=2722755 RepID=UPI001431C9F1|nr:RNA polymerase sigma factor SigJ [Thalassospira sp. HF15]NIY76611.1 RNA polymerase sigma factor SigJ [Thalassospira sp. HF15]